LPIKPSGLKGFSKKLGGRVTSLTNYMLNDGTHRFQVNLLIAASKAEAKKIMRHMNRLTAKEKHDRVFRCAHLIIEFVKAPPALMHRLRAHLGMLDRSRRVYRVEAHLALIERGDAARVNAVFNLLLREAAKQAAAVEAPQGSGSDSRAAFAFDFASTAATARLKTLLAPLQFGNRLALRSAPTAGGSPTYAIRPRPQKTLKRRFQKVFVFKNPPRFHSIPYVKVDAKVATAGFRPAPAAQPPAPQLTQKTRLWPTDHPPIQKLRKTLIQTTDPPAARLRKIHQWVFEKITYGGKRVGSRDGVATVLKRGFGRCWEKADVLVTLARAAGLPARQVAGWMVGRGGHIWAEIFVAGQGWMAADATTPWLGVAGDYVPLLTTDDGDMQVMYLKKPHITRLD
jgi:hypothetical protein